MSSIASNPELKAVKERIKTMWSTGDFGVVAKILEPAEKEMLNRLNIPKGSKLLDVACGNGTVALEAARRGAMAFGIDLVEDLIRQSKEQAKAEGLNIEFITGDAEAMPYSSDEFDYVISMFGAMFCPRPDIAAEELVRVTKPGGTIIMGNWTKEGFGDAFFRTVSAFAPPPPPDSAIPTDWGVEKIVEERLGKKVSKLDMTRVKFTMHIPYSPEKTTEHYIQYFGPVKMLFDTLDGMKKTEFRKSFTKLWNDFNTASDGTTAVETEYLEVRAIK